MRLSDTDLWKLIQTGVLSFTPAVYPSAVGAASVDLRLGETFLTFRPGRHVAIDTKQELPTDYMDSHVLDGNTPFILHPQNFVLGVVLEYIQMPRDHGGTLEGKSTLARMGIIVHTAGSLDPGYEGSPTLELSNHGPLPVYLYPGMYICQMKVEPLSSSPTCSYRERGSSLYLGQRTPNPARTKNLFPRPP